jgi:hypothetical protein
MVIRIVKRRQIQDSSFILPVLTSHKKYFEVHNVEAWPERPIRHAAYSRTSLFGRGLILKRQIRE